jgi:transposase-like protein
MTIFQFPEDIRRRIRTSEVLERVNKKFCGAPKSQRFPNEDSCLRLLSAVLMEILEVRN